MVASRLRSLWRWSRRHAVLVGLLIVVTSPSVAATVSVVGQHWHASFDQALELLRIRDVGGPHTPLLGPWSQWGWAHPGPLLFWALAPFHIAFGDTGVLVGVGIANALTSAAIVGLAYRRGGTTLAVVTTLTVAVLQHSLGLGFLIDPWNPWVVLLPFVLLIFLAWSALCDDLVALGVAAVVGSFIAQTHVGYVPFVAGLVGLPLVRNVVLAIRSRPRPAMNEPARSTRLLWSLITVLLGIAMWTPALAQQLTASNGNLSAIATYARDPGEPTRGASDAFGEMGSQLAPGAGWMTGDYPTFIETGATTPSIVLLSAVAILGAVARKRAHRDRAWLCATTLFAVGLGVVSASRVTGGPWFYVVLWWWALGALVALTLGWTTVCLLPGSIRRFVVRTGAVIAVVVTAATLAGLPAQVPEARRTRAIEPLTQQMVGALDRSQRYLVRGAREHGLGGDEHGFFAALEDRGFLVFVDRTPLDEIRYGSWRLTRVSEVHEIITIVSTLGSTGYVPVGARLIASWDPLTPLDRDRAEKLEASIRTAGAQVPGGPLLLEDHDTFVRLEHGGASRSDLDELLRLQQLGDRYFIYLSPASTTSQQ